MKDDIFYFTINIVKANVGNHLTELEAVDMTIEYLQETDVAKAVYRVLQNCPAIKLKKKHEMLDAAGANSSLTSQNVSKDERTDNEDAKPAGSETSPQQEHLKAMRLKCTKLIYKALTDSATSKEEANKRQELSKEIEECIFALHARNDKKYKNCIRSKVSNLKNPKNFHLKHNLLSGTMSPKTFAEMTVMEMASDELKQLRALYTESSVQEHQLPQVIDGTQTDKIKCRRCEKFDCTVTMIARGILFLPSWVRNANPDEQMMTYVICNECGEQWYHICKICIV
uniref:Transcription elongation factor A N-terminal and central domain containing n=1 Tax=Chelonoidis abingdonii TaxID=106734 RepID=A0A8C0IPX5_CHEAB